jgi:hypothetical protein
MIGIHHFSSVMGARTIKITLYRHVMMSLAVQLYDLETNHAAVH